MKNKPIKYNEFRLLKCFSIAVLTLSLFTITGLGNNIEIVEAVVCSPATIGSYTSLTCSLTGVTQGSCSCTSGSYSDYRAGGAGAPWEYWQARYTGSCYEWKQASCCNPNTYETCRADCKQNNQCGTNERSCTGGLCNASPTCTSISGNGTVNPGGNVALTAVASDPDGTIALYTWFKSGGTLALSSSITNTNTWTAPVNSGSYTINVTVKDDKAATANCPTKTITTNTTSCGPICSTTQACKSETWVNSGTTCSPVNPIGSINYTINDTCTGLCVSGYACNSGACCNPNSWSTCSKTCGTGTQTNGCGQTRNCNTQACVPCPVGLLYVEGNPTDTVIFANPFTTTGNPLLLVTDLPVIVRSNVGLASVAGTFNLQINSSPHIEAAIISSKQITIGGGNPNDRAIILQGPLVSKNMINFNRDLGVENLRTPPQAVKYDPVFLCEATKLEKAHPEYKSYTGLGVYTIQWDYSD